MFKKLIFLLFLHLIVADECGISPNIQKYENLLSSNPTNQKIIGGLESNIEDWPFVVFIVIGGSICTGSIVHNKWILTASHCSIDETSYVLYGAPIGLDGKRVNIAKSISFIPDCHLDENHQCDCCIDNDVRLLELTEAIEFDDTTHSICLTSEEFDQTPGNKIAGAAYGSTKESMSNGILREVVMEVQENRNCNFTSERTFCAGESEHMTNVGDSGGPVMNIKDGRWFQRGVVSAGAFVNDQLFAGKFMKTNIFCDWIQDTTNGDVQCLP